MLTLKQRQGHTTHENQLNRLLKWLFGSWPLKKEKKESWHRALNCISCVKPQFLLLLVPVKVSTLVGCCFVRQPWSESKPCWEDPSTSRSRRRQQEVGPGITTGDMPPCKMFQKKAVKWPMWLYSYRTFLLTQHSQRYPKDTYFYSIFILIPFFILIYFLFIFLFLF